MKIVGDGGIKARARWRKVVHASSWEFSTFTDSTLIAPFMFDSLWSLNWQPYSGPNPMDRYFSMFSLPSQQSVRCCKHFSSSKCHLLWIVRHYPISWILLFLWTSHVSFHYDLLSFCLTFKWSGFAGFSPVFFCYFTTLFCQSSTCLQLSCNNRLHSNLYL